MDDWLNATHILKAGGLNHLREIPQIQAKENCETVKGDVRYEGLYVSPSTALALCERYKLLDVKQLLHTHLKAQDHRHEVPYFSEVEDGSFLPVPKGSFM
jgi:hypothetical protein